MTQRVLTVPADLVDCLYTRRGFYGDAERIGVVMEVIRKAGTFVERHAAERDYSLKQIIACGIVRTEDRVLCLRRSRKSDRAALRLKFTMMIGGHVDQEDAGGAAVLSHCVKRELAEELGLTIPVDPPLLGVVADPLTASGTLHLGIVFDAELVAESIEVTSRHDTSEFVDAGKRQHLAFMDETAVARVRAKLDPWSSLFLGSSRCEEILGYRFANADERQPLLPYR
jgi:predicted NUDIX family phosphoesterase